MFKLLLYSLQKSHVKKDINYKFKKNEKIKLMRVKLFRKII